MRKLMVNFNDILEVIKEKIDDKFPEYDIITGDNESEIISPTFTVQINPLIPKQQGINGLKMTVNVYIGYVTKEHKQSDELKMITSLVRLFYGEIEVFDSDNKEVKRTLPIFEPQIIYGDMPQLNFKLIYHDRIAPLTDVDKNEDYDELINHITIKNKINGIEGDDINVYK